MKLSAKAYEKLEGISLKWVFPTVAFSLVVYYAVLHGSIKQYFQWEMPVDIVFSFLIFAITVYGRKIIVTINDFKERDYFVGQREAIKHAFSNISFKGDELKILIYTSYTIFHNLQTLMQEHPRIKKCSLKLLIRDPDVKGLVPKGNYSHTRRTQLFAAIDSISRDRTLTQNVEIRFHKNEPWSRGIKVGDNFLLHSTYSNKRAVTQELEDEYSGSKTPWIEIDTRHSKTNDAKHDSEKNFIQGFDSLFDLIWENCTKYKKPYNRLGWHAFQKQ